MVEDAISGAKLASCFQALDVACWPLCFWQGDGPVHSRLPLLWYLSFSWESSLSLFFLSLAIPQFGLLSHVSSLRLSSGHAGLVLTLSMQPRPPCPAPAHWWWKRVSGLLLHWELQLGTYSVGFFFFFLLIILPSEIPKLPTDQPVRGFPAVWKLLLHDSLPGTGLHP